MRRTASSPKSFPPARPPSKPACLGDHFAPTKLNIDEAEAVVAWPPNWRVRFKQRPLMRLGTAAKLWDRLEPRQNSTKSLSSARPKGKGIGREAGAVLRPFSLMRAGGADREPSARCWCCRRQVKVAAPLPYLCADLKKQSFPKPGMLRRAWRRRSGASAAARGSGGSRLAEANRWVMLEKDLPAVV